jgi:peptidoglycan/LPS O-acetylase OafA/YrhL
MMKKFRSEVEGGGGSHVGRYYWLDWLRFGAAFVVLVGHVRGGHFVDYGDLDPRDHSLLVAVAFAVTRIGQEAVILFFVLSGFLVGGLSTRKALGDSFLLFPYAIDRLTRIYVPLIPALILTSGVLLFRGGQISLFSMFGNLAGLQGVFVENFGGNAPLWSLAYEIWFYILCGGVLALFVTSSLKVRFFAWLATFASLAVFTKLQAVFLFCWLMGALACVAQPKVSRSVGLLVGFSLIGLGVGLCQLTSNTDSLSIKWLRPLLPSHEVCLLLLSFGFTVLVTTVARWVPQSPQWRRIEELGKPLAAFSYTLYLTHYCIIGIWQGFFPERAKALDVGSFSSFLLELLFCLVGAWIMYFLFEKRTATVRRWINEHWSNRINSRFGTALGEAPGPTAAKIP